MDLQDCIIGDDCWNNHDALTKEIPYCNRTKSGFKQTFNQLKSRGKRPWLLHFKSMMMWFGIAMKKLLTIADEAIPNLKKYPIVPTSIVEIIPDERALAGFRARKKEQSINDLPSYTLGRDESIVKLDLGDHFVGTFSIAIDSVGSPMDAPLYLRVKFAEIPAEIAVESSAYEGWLSRSWIQEEFIHLDVLPAKLSLPRRYSCRYIELKVIDTSPKWKASFSQPQFISESSVDLNAVSPIVVEDQELEAIYTISAKTLADCMQNRF